MRLLPLLPSGPDGVCNYPVRRTQLSILAIDGRSLWYNALPVTFLLCLATSYLLQAMSIPLSGITADPPLRLRRRARSRHHFCFAKMMAEREGFEPSVPVTRYTRFPIVPLRPAQASLREPACGGLPLTINLKHSTHL
jgi:hypothetical protein